MKLGYLIWLVPVLCGCNSTTPDKQASTPMPKELQQLSWLKDADNEKDAHAAIAKKDYRLLALSGRGTMLPGIKSTQAKKAKQQCGQRFMDGMGDTLINKEHRKWWKKGREYAVAYNTIMIKYCLKD